MKMSKIPCPESLDFFCLWVCKNGIWESIIHQIGGYCFKTYRNLKLLLPSQPLQIVVVSRSQHGYVPLEFP